MVSSHWNFPHCSHLHTSVCGGGRELSSHCAERHSPPRVSLAWAQKNTMSLPGQISPSQLHPAQGKGSARVRHMRRGSGRQSPQRLRGSLSMGSAQCYPHFLLIDEASIVVSLLPHMALNQHFQMRNPGPKDLWLIGCKVRIRMQDFQPLSCHSSVPLVNHIECHTVARHRLVTLCVHVPCSGSLLAACLLS